ncbi:hypothetical protein AC1031_012453, partial [Aphanomyces cochlioides]
MQLIPGEYLTIYDGTLLFEHELPKDSNGEYRMLIDNNEGLFLEGINKPTPGLGFGSLVNRANTPQEKNCELHVDDAQAEFV